MGLNRFAQVSDWTTDFCDGTHLCALVENLQKRPLKPSWNRRPGNQHHYLENATVALNAIEGDGIKLVNIGEFRWNFIFEALEMIRFHCR